MSHGLAFILYRQHHQAAVVARNPGLANPKISKIIGDHWRNSSDEVKEHWKSLAEVRALESLIHNATKNALCRRKRLDTRSSTQIIGTNLEEVPLNATPSLSHLRQLRSIGVLSVVEGTFRHRDWGLLR